MSYYLGRKKVLYNSVVVKEDDEKYKNRIGPEDHEKKTMLDAEIREEINREFFNLLKKNTFDENDQRVISSFIDNYIKKNQYFFTDPDDLKSFVNGIVLDIFGLGIIESLRKDSTVQEIWVNGHDHIWYEQDGKRKAYPLKFKDDTSVRNLINKILAPINRKADDSNPLVQGRLSDGSRVSVTLSPVSLNGATVDIRKFKDTMFTLEDYVKIGSCTEQMRQFLSMAVKAKFNIMVSGGTGAGKTTCLNALSAEIPSDGSNEHIITIEDAAELQIYQPFVSRWETKNNNSEGYGAITPKDLVEHSLRNAPDRIILGEIRDDVAYYVLQAANTGHEGTMSTIHANDSRGTIKRFGDLASEAKVLTSKEAQESFCQTFDLIVSVQKVVFPDRPPERKITQITYIAGMGEQGASKLGIDTKNKKIKEDKAFLEDIFKYDKIKRKFVCSGFIPNELITKAKERGVIVPPSIFEKGEIDG